MPPVQLPHSRRAFLAVTGAAALTVGAGLLVRAQEMQPPDPADAVATMPLTPECADADDLTAAQTEGPYFTPNSPERSSLREPDMPGTRILLAGFVLSRDCQPLPGALLDWWQADDAGQYDNVGFRLRGHHFADELGRYQLETIVPGLYPGRTRHFHLKVQAPNGPVLTTQLYFEGEPANVRDRIFHPALVLRPVDTAEGLFARFDFVVRTA